MYLVNFKYSVVAFIKQTSVPLTRGENPEFRGPQYRYTARLALATSYGVLASSVTSKPVLAPLTCKAQAEVDKTVYKQHCCSKDWQGHRLPQTVKGAVLHCVHLSRAWSGGDLANRSTSVNSCHSDPQGRNSQSAVTVSVTRPSSL